MVDKSTRKIFAIITTRSSKILSIQNAKSLLEIKKNYKFLNVLTEIGTVMQVAERGSEGDL